MVSGLSCVQPSRQQGDRKGTPVLEGNLRSDLTHLATQYLRRATSTTDLSLPCPDPLRNLTGYVVKPLYLISSYIKPSEGKFHEHCG